VPPCAVAAAILLGSCGTTARDTYYAVRSIRWRPSVVPPDQLAQAPTVERVTFGPSPRVAAGLPSRARSDSD